MTKWGYGEPIQNAKLESMSRITGLLAVFAILGIGVAGYARTKVKEAPVDPAQGAKLASRIPCDAETNPADEVTLEPTFSSGGWERSFRIEVYEKDYCKRFDLGFKCLQEGHDLWKPEWSVESTKPANGSVGLDACNEWRGKDAPQYLLTGWYREPGDPKQHPWKQVEIKKVRSRWETYEFTDPNGGTARLEIDRD